MDDGTENLFIQDPDVGALDEDVSPILKRISWRLLPYMFLLYVVAYLDRINISFAGLNMNQQLGFGDQVFGLGAGIFFIGYFLFGLPSNLMVAKIGARRWISLIMVIWGVISVSMAVVKDEYTFYALRFILGVAEAGFFPGMILYLTYWFPRRQQGLAIARFMTAVPAAGVLGGLMAAWILNMDMCGLSGWQWLFVMTGCPAVLLGISVWFLLPDGPEEVSWLTAREKQRLITELVLDRGESGAAKELMPVRQMLLNGNMWHLALLYFCLTLGMYGFQLWLPQMIKSFGQISISQTALLSAVPALFQALGMIVVAASAEKFGRQKEHVAVSCVLAAVGLIASGLAHEPIFAMLGLSLSAFGIWGVVGPFWTLPVAALPSSAAAGGIAIINSVGNLGGFAGPYIVGVIKSRTPDFVFSLVALSGFLLIGAMLVLALKTRRS